MTSRHALGWTGHLPARHRFAQRRANATARARRALQLRRQAVAARLLAVDRPGTPEQIAELRTTAAAAGQALSDADPLTGHGPTGRWRVNR